jgi:glutathione-independent formaldehyde dehydrogenase
MKAISYEGVRQMSVSKRKKPTIQSPTDALLRVTTIGICGRDLHMYDGRTPLDI